MKYLFIIALFFCEVSFSQDSAYLYFKKKNIKMPIVNELIWKDSLFSCKLFKISTTNFLFASFSNIDSSNIECGILKLIFIDSVNFLIRDGNWINKDGIKRFDYELFSFAGEEYLYGENKSIMLDQNNRRTRKKHKVRSSGRTVYPK